MIIKLDPLDTLFFRDGKPFAMGDDNWANGIFPPQPSVYFGALRSSYFSNNIDEFKNVNTKNDPTGNLKIIGIYFLDIKGNKIHLPLPMDCVQKKNEKKKNEASILSNDKLDKIQSSCPTNYALKGIDEVENVNGGLINIEFIKKYLKCNEKSFSFIKISDTILIESKIGVGIDKKTGTSEEGKLYRAGMIRMSNLSILLEFEGMDLPESGFMKLGGEGRSVHYEKFSCQKLDLNITADDLTEKKFKIYLSTPSIFKYGWIPEWLNNKNLTYESNGLKMKLLTAAIGKPLSLGGFNIKANVPKPMLKVVPAGSVYYFELIEGDLKEIFKLFNNKAISEYYKEQGYGLAHIGGIHGND